LLSKRTTSEKNLNMREMEKSQLKIDRKAIHQVLRLCPVTTFLLRAKSNRQPKGEKNPYGWGESTSHLPFFDGGSVIVRLEGTAVAARGIGGAPFFGNVLRQRL